MLPDPSVNLAIRCRRDGQGRPEAPRLVVIGPKSLPYLFRFEPGHEIAAVKIKLEWTRPLLGLDPRQHLDGEDELSDASPRLARELTVELADAICVSRSAEELAGRLAGAVLGRAGRTGADAPAAAAVALDAVRAQAGRVRVEAVAREAGLSLSPSPRHRR